MGASSSSPFGAPTRVGEHVTMPLEARSSRRGALRLAHVSNEYPCVGCRNRARGSLVFFPDPSGLGRLAGGGGDDARDCAPPPRGASARSPGTRGVG
jgi:hypothetical protein